MKQEEALVILLSRLTFDKLTKIRIFHLIKNSIDWYMFLNICVKRKLICLVYKNLKDLDIIQLLPMVIINNMQYHYERNQEQNQKFVLAATPVISYFKANAILATPVKGIRFIDTIYRKAPGVRILNDIDFVASTKNQSQIHDYMHNSGYDTYLVNDQDVLCSTNSRIRSYFYIKFEEENPYGRLRIDFDYSYSDKWIKLIQSSKQPIYEFLYLCTVYYNEIYKKIDSNNIASYSYVKLIDIREFCCEYLSTYSIEDIYIHAHELNVKEQVLFTITCLKKFYTDIF